MTIDLARNLDHEASGAPPQRESEGFRSARVVKRSVVIAGHKTSVSLENAFWDALKRFAVRDGGSLAGLIAKVDAERGNANLSSALRVYALGRATAEDGK